MLIFTEAFPKQPFQRISLYRGGDLLSSHCKSKTRTFATTVSNQDCNARVATANIVLKNLLKIDRSR
jgi:hypothetical protein